MGIEQAKDRWDNVWLPVRVSIIGTAVSAGLVAISLTIGRTTEDASPAEFKNHANGLSSRVEIIDDGRTVIIDGLLFPEGINDECGYMVVTRADEVGQGNIYYVNKQSGRAVALTSGNFRQSEGAL